jgi:leader peptidase (prepilin peptidase)/N-methyltransferase
MSARPANAIPAGPSGRTASLSSLLTRFEQTRRAQQLIAAGAAIVTVAAVAIRVRPLEVLPAMLVLCTGLSVAGTCDALWRLLPKRVVYPTWLLGSVGLLAAAATLGPWAALRDAAITTTALFTFFLLLHLASRGSAFAFGDVRLALPVGTTLGWFGLQTVLAGLLISSVTAAALATAVLLRTRRRDAQVPLGTFLALGTIVAVLLH